MAFDDYDEIYDSEEAAESKLVGFQLAKERPV